MKLTPGQIEERNALKENDLSESVGWRREQSRESCLLLLPSCCFQKQPGEPRKLEFLIKQIASS